MTRTLLVSGQAKAGKSILIQSVAREHPDHRWHLVEVERGRASGGEALQRTQRPGWTSAWLVRYEQEKAPRLMAEVVRRIEAEAGGDPAVVAFEGGADPVLRHAYAYDLQVFVAPPPADEEAMFRSNDEARLELQRILRDSTKLGEQIRATAQLAEAEDAAGEGAEIRESQVKEFLAGPLGSELAVRVHLRPEFAAMADADIIMVNTAAGPSFSEESIAWQRLLGLFGRLRKGGSHGPLICACDLQEAQDPSFVRVRRRMSEAVCRT